MATFKIVGFGVAQCQLFVVPECPNHPNKPRNQFKVIQKIEPTPPMPGRPVQFFVCTSCLQAAVPGGNAPGGQVPPTPPRVPPP